MAASSRSVRALSCALFLVPSTGGLPAAQSKSPAWAQGRPVLTCEHCRLEGQEAVLCGPHQEEESTTLAEWGPRMDNAVAQVRGDAMERIASLTLAHANAPSRRVAAVLASALASDEPGNAICALTVLRTGEQHADETVAGLASALERAASAWNTHGERLTALKDKKSEHSDKGEFFSLKIFPDWTAGLVAAAEAYRDDRCVDGLVALLGKDPERIPDELARKTASAILRHPTRRGIQAMIEYRAALSKRLKQGTIPDVGQTSEPTPASSLFNLLHGNEDLAGQSGATLTAIDEALAHCAKDMDLRAPSPVKAEFVKSDTGSTLAWSRWFKKNEELFPSELGRVGAHALRDEH